MMVGINLTANNLCTYPNRYCSKVKLFGLKKSSDHTTLHATLTEFSYDFEQACF